VFDIGRFLSVSFDSGFKSLYGAVRQGVRMLESHEVHIFFDNTGLRVVTGNSTVQEFPCDEMLSVTDGDLVLTAKAIGELLVTRGSRSRVAVTTAVPAFDELRDK